MTEANFNCWVTDFKYVYDKKSKRMLQFTWGWSLNHPLQGENAATIEHCLAQKNYHGELVWNPPLNYMPGGKGRKQLHHLTTPLYNRVHEALRKSKYLDKLDIPVNENKAPERPQDEDPDLPERLEA